MLLQEDDPRYCDRNKDDMTRVGTSFVEFNAVDQESLALTAVPVYLARPSTATSDFSLLSSATGREV